MADRNGEPYDIHIRPYMRLYDEATKLNMLVREVRGEYLSRHKKGMIIARF